MAESKTGGVVYRNLTNRFEASRSAKRARSAGPTASDVALLGPEVRSDFAMKIQHSQPPVWVDTVDNIQENIEEIKKKSLRAGRRRPDHVRSHPIGGVAQGTTGGALRMVLRRSSPRSCSSRTTPSWSSGSRSPRKRSRGYAQLNRGWAELRVDLPQERGNA